MAFDENNPADIAALASEYQTDPVGQGYAAALAIGDSKELTRLINSDSQTVPQPMKSSADFTGEDYVEAVTTTNGSGDNEREEVLGAGLTQQAAISGAGSAQAALAELNLAAARREAALIGINYFAGYREETIPFRFKEELLKIWNNLESGNDVRQALIALAQGPMSRAEELWAEGDVISNSATQKALASM